MLAERAECVDQQTLKVQERPEDVPTGDLPRSMMALVDRKLVGSVSPGTRVTVVGILSIFQGKDGKSSALGLEWTGRWGGTGEEVVCLRGGV